jgi:hypothetical protein
MLDGIEANRIIVGAYTDRTGGLCPMLAAHRHGGRTDVPTFAKAWDRYTGAKGRPRPATDRELNALRAMLEASIAMDEMPELSSVKRPARPRRWRLLGRDRSNELATLERLQRRVAGPDELDLGDDAGGRGAQQVAHSL